MVPFDLAPLTRPYACPELAEGLRANGVDFASQNLS